MGRPSTSSCAPGFPEPAKLFRQFARLSPMRRQKEPSHPSSLKALGAKASRASFFGTDVARFEVAGAARHEPLRPDIVRFRVSRMRRYPSPYISSYSFGPGGISTAVKYLIAANVGAFVFQFFFAPVTAYLGLHPADVVGRFWIWQLGTYMFLHGGVFHIVFNMLALWMFGTELELRWGTRYFVKFYAVTGIGAGLLTVLFSLLPIAPAASLYMANIIGASGAIFGLLIAYAIYFPERQIIYLVFPIPSRVFVAIVGGIALLSSFGDAGGVAAVTHLGGLAVGYVYLKSARMHPVAEIKYRYLKWKINRVRKKFDVYSGGRANDYDRRIH